MLSKNLEIRKKAVPLHSVISFSVINYVVSMRGPHVSGDNLFFLFILIPGCPKPESIPIRGIIASTESINGKSMLI